MGNSNCNEASVTLRLTYQFLDVLPQIPSKFSKRIDKRTWSEFRNICEFAVPVSHAHHATTNKHAYDALIRKKCIWMILVALFYMVLYKSIDNLWINIIIFVLLLVTFIIPITQYSHQKNHFIQHVKSKLRRDLSTFNQKYKNRMQCTITQDQTHVMITSIKIRIELFVSNVEYVANPGLLGKLSKSVIGLLSGGIMGGIIGVAVVGASIFTGGCMAATSIPCYRGCIEYSIYRSYGRWYLRDYFVWNRSNIHLCRWL
eukprot:544998_1